MSSPNVIQFTDSNFEAEVLNSQQPVLVDFWAQWCPPCRALAPTIDAVAGDVAGKAKVGKVNTDENRAVAGKYGITSIPTVIVFKAGREVARLVGLRPKAQYVAALGEAAAAA
jgi:thioredoxin 1